MGATGSQALTLFPDHRSRYLFVARVLVLVIATLALAAYGWNLAAESRDLSALTPSSLSQQVSQALPDAGDLSTQLDSTGLLKADAMAISDDGWALVRFSKGTQMLDAAGQPLRSITVSTKDLPLRTDVAVVGRGYAFGPEATRLDPPAALTIEFNPKAYYPFSYQNVDCTQMHIARVNSEGAPMAPWLKVNLDQSAHLVTASIDRLGTFMLFCDVLGTPISRNESIQKNLRTNA